MNTITAEVIEPKISIKICDKYPNDEDLVAYYNNNFKIVEKGSWNQRCHNYALGDSSLNFFDSFNVLKRNYVSVKLALAKKGDIVSYHSDNLIAQVSAGHFAVIVKTDGTLQGTHVRSKWGASSIFETKIDEVVDIYGNFVVFWRKKKKD